MGGPSRYANEYVLTASASACVLTELSPKYSTARVGAHPGQGGCVADVRLHDPFCFGSRISMMRDLFSGYGYVSSYLYVVTPPLASVMVVSRLLVSYAYCTVRPML